jgi:hypothetical protein
MPLSITSAAYATRFRWMWGTIPVQLKKRPTSQRNPAPHRNGTLPHFKRNQCPTSTGIRTMP